jgi:hypothetical protein
MRLVFATWTRKEAPSLHGKPNNILLEEAKKTYNWIAFELFYLKEKSDLATSPRRACKAHACTILSRGCTWKIQHLISSKRIEILHQHVEALVELIAINLEVRATIYVL